MLFHIVPPIGRGDWSNEINVAAVSQYKGELCGQGVRHMSRMTGKPAASQVVA
jgi:hypothetical protein